jgi:hypothetical protein
VTLARLWRRQLCAASSAALIVPAAMFAALVALALGGGFSQLGVLGQVFAGPPAPSVGPLAPSGSAARTGGGVALAGIPIPVTQTGAIVRGVSGGGGGVVRRRVAPTVPSTGVRSAGGTIAPGGVASRPITQAPAPVAAPPRPAPTPVSSPPSPSPSSAPSPHPATPVDTVTKVVTSLTSQVPAPVGPALTQTVQSAGNAADSLLAQLP